MVIFAPSLAAIACMSATSSSTRATAAGHTRIISSCAFFGSTAIVSAMRQCACDAKPSSAARSARSFTIFAMVALVSFSLPLSPRFLNAFHTFSRSSRRDDAVRNGSTLERVLTTAHLPDRLRSSAAALYAARSDSGRPARSAFFSSTTQLFSSASTLLAKSLNETASSWLIWPSFFFCSPSSLAPARTKSSWVRSSSRFCSADSPAASRPS